MNVRRILVTGNAKMNLDRQGLTVLLEKLLAGLDPQTGAADVAYCPPFTLLRDAHGILDGSGVDLGAQNVFGEEAGAYTGEISAAMLLEAGCRFVIVGHSERRSIFKETDAMVARKTGAVLAAGMVPIVCVGETQEERDRGETLAVLTRQIQGSLAGVDPSARPVIAYEPVWAIGTGRTASPEEAQDAHAHLRRELESLTGPEGAAEIRILYGGSVNPGNASDLLARPDIDGALVGGASLKAEPFLDIIRAAG